MNVRAVSIPVFLRAILFLSSLGHPLFAWAGGEAWSGTLEFGERALPFHAVLEHSPDRPLEARVHLPALGLMNLRFASIESGEDRATILEWRNGERRVRLTGDLTKESWNGRWAFGPRSGSFTLSRVAATAPYLEKEVEFESGDATLSGTLIVPQGDGPFPTIVWSHGSGEVGRSSPTYIREAYALAYRGVASFVYDKRGVGRSEGQWREARFTTLASDLTAALSAIRSDSRLDPDRVGVGGISQGPSWIVPLALADGADFDFVIALSAAAVSPSLQHRYVVRRRMEKAGVEAEAIARAIELHERFDLVRVKGEAKTELDAELARVRDEPWFRHALLPRSAKALPANQRSWWTLDPIPLWKRTEVPVLAVWGERDEIVDPLESARIFRAQLGSRVTLHTLPRADHSLQWSGAGELAPVAPELHPLIQRWLVTR